MTTETNRATPGAGAAVPTSNSRRGMIHLDLLSYRETGTTAISIRRRWPASFPDESLAVAQAIALLKQHSELCGFILVPDGLQAANDAYLHERTITRATMARKARQRRKQAVVQQWIQPTQNNAESARLDDVRAFLQQIGGDHANR